MSDGAYQIWSPYRSHLGYQDPPFEDDVLIPAGSLYVITAAFGVWFPGALVTSGGSCALSIGGVLHSLAFIPDTSTPFTFDLMQLVTEIVVNGDEAVGIVANSDNSSTVSYYVGGRITATGSV